LTINKRKSGSGRYYEALDYYKNFNSKDNNNEDSYLGDLNGECLITFSRLL
jgi:hypothetical protein